MGNVRSLKYFSSKNNLVQHIANLFDKKKEFRISLSPEGTRNGVKKFKTGFYYIAKTAEVPIIMITMDYKNKKSFIASIISGEIIKNLLINDKSLN